VVGAEPSRIADVDGFAEIYESICPVRAGQATIRLAGQGDRRG
jgi:hypothetical protein